MPRCTANPTGATRRHSLAWAWFLALVCSVASAQNHAPYTVVETGEKAVFGQIDKGHLGRLCSVFHKPDRPIALAAVGGEDPKGMVTQHGNVRIVTGELHAIGRDHLQIIGFYGADRERGGSRWHHIRAEDIDYVVFREPGPGQQPAGGDRVQPPQP